MRILALEPYYGGSHRAFLDKLIDKSRHDWTLLTLPAHQWKWRMRHAPITFAKELRERVAENRSWDAIFCSDMLALAEFRGLAPEHVRNLPAVVFFHENQLTYPVAHHEPRDLHFGFSNLQTALAAERVWFNSEYHRTSFLDALAKLLPRMPDYNLTDVIETIRAKSEVTGLGIEAIEPKASAKPQDEPIRIVWAARWEHDKNPETFFHAIEHLAENGMDFRLSVIGEQFQNHPAVFDKAQQKFSQYIDRWGYQPTREEYLEALQESHVFVSTAKHEFFGISVVEAILCGAYPLLPERLSYPELLELREIPSRERFFYDGSVEQLTKKLTELIDAFSKGHSLFENAADVRIAVSRFTWDRRISAFDDGLQLLASR